MTVHPLDAEADREKARSLRVILGGAAVVLLALILGVVFVELLNGPRWIIGLVYATLVLYGVFMFRAIWRFASAVDLYRRL